jgi:hypothetical protein
MQRVGIAALLWLALTQSASALASAPARSFAHDDASADANAIATSSARVGMCDASALPLTAASLVIEAQQPMNDDAPLAWCLTPDDPRCQARDASQPPDAPRGHAPLAWATQLSLPAARVYICARLPRAFQHAGARSGERGRVERPPRAL